MSRDSVAQKDQGERGNGSLTIRPINLLGSPHPILEVSPSHGPEETHKPFVGSSIGAVLFFIVVSQDEATNRGEAHKQRFRDKGGRCGNLSR